MLTVEPFPYQNSAIELGLERGNLLIAYGMGLGKTLIQMAICEELLGTGESTLNAIVVPASLKWQWAQALVWGTDVSPREFRVKGQKIIVPERHHAVVIDGTPEKRDTQYEFVFNYRPNYVILGYDNVVNDWRWVKQLKPDLISLDEATAIKTFSAERTKQLKLWDAPFRYALTGTPIDNRADELFSIMEWVDPSELGRDDLFEKAFVRRNRGKVLGYKNLDVLHKKVQGFVARKTRFDPDVAPYMPKDFHREFHVNLVGKTKEMYKEIAGELIEALEEIAGYDNFDVGSYYAGTQTSSGTEEQGNAMARHNALTMLCDDPHLLLESAWKFENDFKAEKNSIGGSKYAWQLLQDGRLDWITDKIIVPKFERTVDLVMDEVDENADNKIIVFSFAKGILRYFKNHLQNEGVQAVIFSGDQTSAEKEAAKQAFKTDPQVRVFLSSDAGGMGVDLPEANTLINYNHPWSAGKADQRNSRHIRAGSLWDEVAVYNMLVSGSVEEWKFDILDRKRALGSAILDGGKTDRGEISFDVGSLLNYVRISKV